MADFAIFMVKNNKIYPKIDFYNNLINFQISIDFLGYSNHFVEYIG